MLYKVSFEGFVIIDADSKEEAEEMAMDECWETVYDEKEWKDAVECGEEECW